MIIAELLKLLTAEEMARLYYLEDVKDDLLEEGNKKCQIAHIGIGFILFFLFLLFDSSFIALMGVFFYLSILLSVCRDIIVLNKQRKNAIKCYYDYLKKLLLKYQNQV